MLKLEKAITLATVFLSASALTVSLSYAQDTPAPKTPANKAPAPDAPAPDAAAPDANKKPAPDAPPQSDLDKAKEAFVAGRQKFDAKDFKGAVELFKESYRLSKNPLLLYNIGFTHDELGDKTLALFYYKKFLRDAPAGVKNRDAATSRVKVLEREVEADSVFAGGAGTGDTKTGTGDTKDPAAAVTEFQHNVVEEVPPGKPLDVSVFVPDGSGWQVKLFYRSRGQSTFQSTEMRPRYNELVGRVPAAVTASGSNFQYYIEARDKSGKIVARSGKSTSPHLVLISDTAKPRYYPDLNSDRDNNNVVVPSRPGDGSGGFLDYQSTKFQYLKWGTTGAAVGLIALSTTFWIVAADAGSSIEGEAIASRDSDSCPSGPPCRAYSQRQRDLQKRGERFELLGNIGIGIGVVATGAAVTLWYLEMRDKKKSKNNVMATPVVGQDYLGAAAALSF